MAEDPIEAAEAAPEPETAPEAAPEPSAEAVKADRLKEIIRSHLRNSPVSRTVEAWNHLESSLGAIVADILKEA